jgi:ribosomal protein S18 acetylase RimI-like enzyme
MTHAIQVRLATPRDAQVLIEFNSAMALETEDKELLPDVIGAGVHALLASPASGFYVVAESAERVVGSLLITKEWSDWRNGTFWWIQSVYVRPEFRRQGVYKSLYRHVQELAARDPAVCGFRLYVERENRRAQGAYRTLGMNETRYLVFEELKPGVRFFRGKNSGTEP